MMQRKTDHGTRRIRGNLRKERRVCVLSVISACSICFLLFFVLSAVFVRAQNPTGRDIPPKKPGTAEKKPAPARRPTPRPAPSRSAPVGSPAPATARLIISAPPGAIIDIDGQRHTADRAGDLIIDRIPAGSHQLSVTAAGFAAWRGSVQVSPPASGFTAPMRNSETTGRLAVFISEAGTDLLINGQSQGFKSSAGAPVVVNGLRPGPYEVRAVRRGFEEWSETVQVTAGLRRAVVVNLKPTLKPETIRIPAGAFRMGDDRGAKDARPARSVTLRGFEISSLEVTNRLYKAFIDAAGYAPPLAWSGRSYPEGQDEAPVTGIRWIDAEAFCRWLSQQTGQRYRLPTEAEWERAVSAKGSEFSSIGRIWEWCADWYDPEYYKRGESLNPTGPPRGVRVKKQGLQGEARVIRGGIFGRKTTAERASVREFFIADRARSDIGFRVVRDAAP